MNIFVDFFQFSPGGGPNVQVNVFFDTDDLSIKTDEPGYLLTPEQRGRPPGEYFTTVNYDGIAYYIFSQFGEPYAYIDSSAVIPEVPTCDIVVTADATPETAAGAQDGTITSTVMSSYTGKEVSIDGVTWFADPHIFTGVAPGTITVYARDANLCAASVQLQVVAFDNPVEQGFLEGLPTIQVSPGNLSRWNAAFNPIVLRFKTDITGKPNYRIEIEITTIYGSVTGSYYPAPDGSTRADISAYLRSFVRSRDLFRYDALNWRDLDRAASYTLRYREIWTGAENSWYSAPDPLYVTYSAMQLGDLYGGNMGSFVTFESQTDPDKLARFLTHFEEPTVWTDLPFDNSFILSEHVVTKDIKLRTESLDINKKLLVGTRTDSLLLNDDGGFILASPDSRFIIEPGVLPPIANDGIFEQLGINRLMLAGTPGLNVEYFRIQLYTGDDESPNFITAPLTLKIGQECQDPYIYLKWLNTLGGWDYWRFGVRQTLSVNTANVIQIDRNVMDWQNDTTIASVVKKTAGRRWSFGDIVGAEKILGLIGLHESTAVQMLVSENPIKWQTVVLNVGSFSIRQTDKRSAEVKFSIDMPERNIQINGA